MNCRRSVTGEAVRRSAHSLLQHAYGLAAVVKRDGFGQAIQGNPGRLTDVARRRDLAATDDSLVVDVQRRFASVAVLVHEDAHKSYDLDVEAQFLAHLPPHGVLGMFIGVNEPAP